MRLLITLPPSAHSGSAGDIAKCHRDGAYSTVPNRPNRVGTNVQHYVLLVPEMEQVREPCNDPPGPCQAAGHGERTRRSQQQGQCELAGQSQPHRGGSSATGKGPVVDQHNFT